MSFVRYGGLIGANEILAAVSQAASTHGWSIIENCIDDLPIDGDSAFDGKKLTVSNAAQTFYATFRSGGEKKIFPSQAAHATGGTTADGNPTFHADCIGLIASDAYSRRPAEGKWYNQPNAPKASVCQDPVGVGVPVVPGAEYTVFVNFIDDPADLMVVSLTAYPFDQPDGRNSGAYFQHMTVGTIERIGNWDVGTIISGSRSHLNLTARRSTAGAYDPTELERDDAPLFSANANANTYLRIDMDNAPNRGDGVRWASACPAGSATYTGKELALPIHSGSAAKIPVQTYFVSTTLVDGDVIINPWDGDKRYAVANGTLVPVT